MKTTDSLNEIGAVLQGIYQRDPDARNKETNVEVQRFAKQSVASLNLPPGTSSLNSPNQLTDLGNAQRMVDLHGQDLRYCEAWGWMVWDGSRWTRDGSGEVERRAKHTVKSILEEAAKLNQCATAKDVFDRRLVEQATDLQKHAIRSQSRQRIDAMIALAKSDERVVSKTENFDTHPWLFNVANGTIDLTTGNLKPHRREDFITKLSPINYEPAATAPFWDQFLLKIMDKKEDLVAFLQRAVGYSLTGVIRDRRCLFFCYGSGANGKSRLLAAIRRVLGEYAQQAPASLLQNSGNRTSTNDLARMIGIRLATITEAAQGMQGSEEIIKTLGGGEPIAVRHLYREYFEFTPQAKIWWGLNDKPRLRDDDRALWDRLYEIPFTVRIAESERIPEDKLDALLAAESEGILAWAVSGCLTWKQDGLAPPNSIKEATEAYRKEMDPLNEFLEDRCIIDEGASVSVSELRQAYDAWAEESGVRFTLGKKKFSDRLKVTGVVAGKGSGGKRMWRGIGLLADQTGET